MGIKRKIPFKLLGFTGILTITVMVLHISFSITSLQPYYNAFQNRLTNDQIFLKTIRLHPQNRLDPIPLTVTNEIKNSVQNSKTQSVVKHEVINAELSHPVEDEKTRPELENSVKNEQISSQLANKYEKTSAEVATPVKDEQKSSKLANSVNYEESSNDVATPVKDEQASAVLFKSVKDETHVELTSAKDDVGKGHVPYVPTFVKCDAEKKSVFSIETDVSKYFEDLGHGLECYIKGTDRTATLEKAKQRGKDEAITCSCLPGYYGSLCSIPDAVWLASPENRLLPIRRRSKPRRIINGLPFHHELDMLDARLDEIGDVTDVFIVTESNYTAFGDPKPLWLLEKLNQGYASEVQRKILYILLDWFPEGGREDGWIADGFFRHYLGLWGLPCLKDLHDDDIFVLSDADELPSREVITFLKLHEGFPEPISFSLRWTIFGFFWRERTDLEDFGGEKLTTKYSAVTVKLLRDFLNSNAYKIRNDRSYSGDHKGVDLRPWNIGVPKFYAGWHCSWCFDAKGIVQKLDAAQSDDGPRWGNFPAKKQIPYIEGLIRYGRWFDDHRTFATTSPNDPMYAPDYFLRQPDRYRFLLKRPDENRPQEDKG